MSGFLDGPTTPLAYVDALRSVLAHDQAFGVSRDGWSMTRDGEGMLHAQRSFCGHVGAPRSSIELVHPPAAMPLLAAQMVEADRMLEELVRMTFEGGS